MYHKLLQRDHRRGARLDRGIAHDLQLAQHLDHAIRSLRGRRGLTGQHGPGSDLGIDSVGLARRAARAPVSPMHLHHTMPCAAHRPGEAGAIAAGAFDAERFDPPVRVCPPDQGPIAPRIRNQRVVAEAGPPRVDHDRNMHILMGSTPTITFCALDSLLTLLVTGASSGCGPLTGPGGRTGL